MSQVSVTINGRQFRMGCEDGQEDHLTDLARELDARIADLRTKFGEIGDLRLTVMAALTIADELTEMGSRIKKLEQDLAAAQDAQPPLPIATRRCRRRSPQRLRAPPSASKASPKSSIMALAATAWRKGDGARPILALHYTGRSCLVRQEPNPRGLIDP